MTIDQANKVIAAYEPQAIFFAYNILFTNDIVCGRVIEDMQELKNSPLYKRETKQCARKIAIARHEYEKLLNEIIAGTSEFFANANDTFLEEVYRHVQVLYYSIKREFDRNKVLHSGLIARLETTSTLCEFACKQFDSRMEELVKLDPRFRGFKVQYMRLTNLSRLYKLLMGTFTLPCVIDLNTSDCLLSVEILSQRLVDGHLIAKAISENVAV